MKRKALITTAAAVALVGIVGIGSTLAYFTDNDNEVNTLTFGHVDIELDEPNFSENNKENTIAHIVPGQEIEKDPTITVAEDSEVCYLRASIEIVDKSEVLTEDLQAQLIDGITFAEDWEEGTDGYYYYQKKAQPGAIVPFFTQVTIPAEWTNEVADLTFQIDVKAEAIQADNFEPAKADDIIRAWTTKDGQPITTETYERVAAEQSGN